MGEAFNFSSWERPRSKPDPEKPKGGDGVVLSEANSISPGFVHPDNPIAGFSGEKKPATENLIEGFKNLFSKKRSSEIPKEDDLRKVA